MNKIILIVLFSILSQFTYAQSLFNLGRKKGDIKYIDKTSASKNRNKVLLSIDLLDKKVEWASLLYTPTGRGVFVYGLENDATYLYKYTSDLTLKNWSISTAEILSIPKESVKVHGFYETMSGRYSYPIFIFYHSNTLHYNVKGNARSEWITKRSVHRSLKETDTIVGVIKDDNAMLNMLINTKDKDGNGSIQTVKSKDAGINWELPNISIKHNKISLKGWSVFAKRNGEKYYMILSDEDMHPYVSYSVDSGKTWSYPTILSDKIVGKNYKIYIRRNNVVIIYQPISKMLDFQHENDIVLWSGTLNEFMNGSINKGNFKVIVDSSDKVKDVELIDIIYTSRGRYLLSYKYKDESFNEIIRVNVFRK